ncbi:MAG: N-acetylmuramidase family protein [Muribaculaceae bacterium]|nr:N-acetylmuramidase family protein [Muribaculaceae bacterium]
MRQRAALLTGVALMGAALFSLSFDAPKAAEAEKPYEPTPPAEAQKHTEQNDTIIRLTEQDFAEVADSLGVEVAAIKAVVDIEAGRTHEGFSAPGKPLINFDLTMFRRFASRRGVNLAKYSKSHPVVFSSHKGSQTRAQRRLEAARSINPQAAVEGTFWGMFQIGGFNWKKCGASSLEDFEMRMSRSERDQLDMFASFIKNAGLLPALRSKNWAKFARGYNGPSYAKRGYHTRMAAAYARHNKERKN